MPRTYSSPRRRWAERLGSADLHIIEIDEDSAAYERGHVPGAVALDWRSELQRADPPRG